MKRQHCPICKKSVRPNDRYQRYLCSACARLASTADGRRLGFSNTDISGGFVATLAGTGIEYPSHVCFINGVPCWADEARFGGIVIEAIEPEALKSLIDRSGRPTRLSLTQFINEFASSFRPPIPYRGKNGTSWFVSNQWSEYLKSWLRERYQAKFEVRLPKRRRLDAALWTLAADMRRDQIDIALEWEWDNNKVESEFHCGDFRKLFEIDAQCGLAIIQTRTHSSGGASQAERILKNLRSCFNKHRALGRSVALIEIRRIRHAKDQIEFVANAYDLDESSPDMIASWRFPA